MSTISLCMIVKNEEKVLSRCLESIKNYIDEIIIVDTGSTDQTKVIAGQYTDKVFSFEWSNNFSAARNYSFSLATSDYILWLDADDVLLSEDQEKFRILKNNLDLTEDIYSMVYNYAFDVYGKPSLSFRRNRIVKASRKFIWQGAVHEYLDVSGRVTDTDICITHKRIHYASERNLRIYQEMINKEIPFTTRDIYYYAKELYDNELFEQAKEYFVKFLEKSDAWFEDQISACLKLSNYFFSQNQYSLCRNYSFKTFEYDVPRAQALCQIGLAYMAQKRWEEAVYWYEMAEKQKSLKSEWQYVNEACNSWLPHLQLCVCYFNLGDYIKAYQHNEVAYEFCPKHESVIYNKMMLDSFSLTK